MEKLHATADADALITRAAQLLAAGRAGAARPLLSAARRLNPRSTRTAELSARLALRFGATDHDMAELDAAVETEPTHAGLRKCRAELRQNRGDVHGAAQDAAEAVILNPADPIAKALLGVLMLELGRAADAEACLAEAVAAEPANPAFREGLAAAQEATGEPDLALGTLRDGIDAAPGLVEPRNAAILHCVRHRDFRQAVALAEAARVAGTVDACLFGLKGHALSSLGLHEEAAEAYAEALKLGPEDPYVRHLVAAAGVVPEATRAPADYLRSVFDGYAERFEAHLVALGYRMPGLFRAVLQQHPAIAAGEQVGPVFDLGCGTGLLGVAISDLPFGPLVGVDISSRMLAQAQAKQLYSELREADVMTVLAEPGPEFPVILAADVLCYFGDLSELFQLIHAKLASGGWFVCSTEELLPDRDGVLPGRGESTNDWALHSQGRYAHAFSYFQRTAVAAGFNIRRFERQTVRYEADAPVAGMLAVLERPRDDG